MHCCCRVGETSRLPKALQVALLAGQLHMPERLTSETTGLYVRLYSLPLDFSAVGQNFAARSLSLDEVNDRDEQSAACSQPLTETGLLARSQRLSFAPAEGTRPCPPSAGHTCIHAVAIS